VLGNVFSGFDSTAKAAFYYHKGLELAEETDRTSLMMTYLNNLMSLHAETPDSLTQTISYFQRGKVLATKYDDFRNLLALHGNMARAYDAANEPEMATSYFLMGMDWFDLADDMGVKASFLLHYGKHLFRNGNIAIAEVNLNKALGLARLSGEASTQMSIYRTLASIDSINGNYQEALKHLHRSLTIRDSIYTVKKSAIIAEIQLMHNIHQYEWMVSNLTSENRYNKLRYRFSVLAGITGFALLGLGIVYLRKRKILAEHSLTIRELEHSKLQVKYESNRQELTGKVMALMNSERLIKKLQCDLKSYLAQADDECRHKLQPVIRDLNTEDKSKELWHDFENRFNELNDGFIAKLTAAHPDLSPAEIRLCAMLRLQIPSKEISQLSQRSLRTIEQSRFKIRKKIGLKSGDNLVTYLLNL
jgi:tetratricopeptide (TPR) repeat protein/DNA-binding CsgD family transcriptional regulator